MTKDRILRLQKFSQLICEDNSKSRELNKGNNTFSVYEIIPLSASTAAVKLVQDTGVVSVAFCYYIERGVAEGWRYFFPTDSHILGLMAFPKHKEMVEGENFYTKAIEATPLVKSQQT